ncbi:MAG TPA: hypothetical protein VFQ38_03350 [Longimicrobiales bacterium]|nr:hypothetical protein [Longimicrobiales bacterium]
MLLDEVVPTSRRVGETPARREKIAALAACIRYAGREEAALVAGYLHLGARDPESGAFVMPGKTFKGLTDRLLERQTRELLARELGREGHIVHVRPELVVEVAFEGVQASPRYSGGLALRFARVKRYRPDKTAADADTIDRVRALHRA